MTNPSDLADYVNDFISKLRSVEDKIELPPEGGEYSELYRILISKGIETYTNEASNRDLIDWKRARSLIEPENILINHRLTWLLATQGPAFAIFGILLNFLSNKSFEGVIKFPLYIIPFFSVLMCINTYMNINKAITQISRSTDWWYNSRFRNNRGTKIDDNADVHSPSSPSKRLIDNIHKNHPPLHFWHEIEDATESDYTKYLLRSSLFIGNIQFIPWLFMTTWIAFVLGLLLNDFGLWEFVKSAILPYIPIVVGTTVIVIFVVFMFVAKALKSRPAS